MEEKEPENKRLKATSLKDAYEQEMALRFADGSEEKYRVIQIYDLFEAVRDMLSEQAVDIDCSHAHPVSATKRGFDVLLNQPFFKFKEKKSIEEAWFAAVSLGYRHLDMLRQVILRHLESMNVPVDETWYHPEKNGVFLKSMRSAGGYLSYDMLALLFKGHTTNPRLPYTLALCSPSSFSLYRNTCIELAALQDYERGQVPSNPIGLWNTFVYFTTHAAQFEDLASYFPFPNNFLELPLNAVYSYILVNCESQFEKVSEALEKAAEEQRVLRQRREQVKTAYKDRAERLEEACAEYFEDQMNKRGFQDVASFVKFGKQKKMARLIRDTPPGERHTLLDGLEEFYIAYLQRNKKTTNHMERFANALGQEKVKNNTTLFL